MYGGDRKKEIMETLEMALKKKYDDCIIECAYNENLQPFPYKFR